MTSIEKNNNTRTYAAGDLIIEKGGEAKEAYLIRGGSVQVFITEGTKRVDLAILNEGDIFGETAIFTDENYGANVEAVDDTEVFILSPASLEAMLKGIDPTIRAIIRMLINRLKRTNSSLATSETRQFMDIDFI